MTPEDKAVKLVKSVLSELKGKELVGVAKVPPSANPSFISTGSKFLDWALGKGLALGRVIEIFSNKEAEGKSSVSLSLIKSVQECGGITVLIDTEQGNIVEHLNEFGIQGDKLIFGVPDTMEEVFELLEATLKVWNSEDFGIVVWDSVTATPTKEQLEAEYGDKLYSPQARVMSQSLPKIVKMLADKQVALVVTNQTRTKVGNVYGDPFDTTCGKALKFYASQRIKLSIKEVVYTGKQVTPVGAYIKATVVKNKVARPFRTAMLYLDFKKGFDETKEAIEFGKMTGKIVEDKGWSTIEGRNGKMRKQQLIELLETDTTLREELWKDTEL